MSLTSLCLALQLGKSGEVYLVNKDGVFVTESRFAHWLKRKGMIKERTTLELKGDCSRNRKINKVNWIV